MWITKELNEAQLSLYLPVNVINAMVLMITRNIGLFIRTAAIVLLVGGNDVSALQSSELD